MENELGTKGIQTIINALIIEGVNPPAELTIEILKEMYRERIYKILDDQVRAFSSEKVEQTLLQVESKLKPQEVFVAPTKLLNEPINIKVDGKRKSKVKE